MVAEAEVAWRGIGSDRSAVGDVRGDGSVEFEGMPQRGNVRPPANVVAVSGELVLGDDEGEESLPEAGGADANSVLVRVTLALHRLAAVATSPTLLPLRPQPPASATPLPTP